MNVLKKKIDKYEFLQSDIIAQTNLTQYFVFQLILFAALVAVASAYHGGNGYGYGYSGYSKGGYSSHRYGRSLGYKHPGYSYGYGGHYGHHRHARSPGYAYGNAYGAHPYGSVSRAVYNQYPSRYGYYH